MPLLSGVSFHLLALVPHYKGLSIDTLTMMPPFKRCKHWYIVADATLYSCMLGYLGDKNRKDKVKKGSLLL